MSKAAPATKGVLYPVLCPRRKNAAKADGDDKCVVNVLYLMFSGKGVLVNQSF
jgi:hypothetical protein